MLAESQAQQMEVLKSVNSKAGKDSRDRKTKISSIVVNKFKGGTRMSTKKYRRWKKEIEAVAQHYELAPAETAMLIWLNCEDDAKEVVDV